MKMNSLNKHSELSRLTYEGLHEHRLPMQTELLTAQSESVQQYPSKSGAHLLFFSM